MNEEIIALIEWCFRVELNILDLCIIRVTDLEVGKGTCMFFLTMGDSFRLGCWGARIPYKVEWVLVIFGGLGGGFSFGTFKFDFLFKGNNYIFLSFHEKPKLFSFK